MSNLIPILVIILLISGSGAYLGNRDISFSLGGTVMMIVLLMWLLGMIA